MTAILLTQLALALEPPPLDLIGLESTPKGAIACELIVQDHDAVGTPWDFRIAITEPDAEGRSWIQRITVGTGTYGMPGSHPVSTVRELDVQTRFVDERVKDGDSISVFTFVKPRAIDWSVWPLKFSFIAPRADAPDRVGEYTLKVSEEGAKNKEAWGSCILDLSGPNDVGGCTMFEEVRGGCIKDYVKRHKLR